MKKRQLIPETFMCGKVMREPSEQKPGLLRVLIKGVYKDVAFWSRGSRKVVEGKPHPEIEEEFFRVSVRQGDNVEFFLDESFKGKPRTKVWWRADHRAPAGPRATFVDVVVENQRGGDGATPVSAPPPLPKDWSRLCVPPCHRGGEDRRVPAGQAA